MKKFPIIAAALSMGLITTPAIAHPHAGAEAETKAPERYIKPPGQCGPIGEDTFRAIKKGMTIDQVEWIVGCRGKESVTVSVHDGEKIKYRFVGGKRSYLYVWMHNGFLDQKGGR